MTVGIINDRDAPEAFRRNFVLSNTLLAAFQERNNSTATCYNAGSGTFITRLEDFVPEVGN